MGAVIGPPGIEPELRLSAAKHAAAALVAVALAATAIAARLDLSAAYVARTLFVTTVGLLVLARLLPAHAPFRELGPGNRVTLTRASIVALLAGAVSESLAPVACWFLVGAATIAAFLDIADGQLARRSGMASAFGARFDMETDAAMIAVLSILAWQLDKAGPWILVAGALRYAFVAAAAAWPWLATPLPPSRRRQTACVVQIVVLIVLLAPIIGPPFSTLLGAASVTLLCYSFAVDVHWLHRCRPHGGPR